MNKERNKEIYELWLSVRNAKPPIGVRKIGKMYHLTGSRVHQIIKKMRASEGFNAGDSRQS